MECLMTVPEFAKVLGASPSTGWRMVLSGVMPSHKIGRSRRVAESDVRAMLAASRQEHGKALGKGVCGCKSCPKTEAPTPAA